MKQSKINDFVNRIFNLKPFLDILTGKVRKLKKVLYSYVLQFFVLICILCLAIWGTKWLWYSLTDLNIFKVSPHTFSFHTPSWVTDRFSNDIKHVASLQDQYGMFENKLTQTIADIYGGIVLIKKVDSIKRIFPNKLSIKLILRKPTAIVKSGNNTYLVDDECILLPKEYYLLPNPEYDNPVIQSNKLARLPLHGSKWNDKGVEVGIELIKFLRANNVHNLFKILTVDVSNVCKRRFTGKSDIILWTENNTQIRWGCSPLCKEPNELSDEEKLQNLLSIAKLEGTNLKHMEYVDVRWKKPLGKRWVEVNTTAEEQ